MEGSFRKAVWETAKSSLLYAAFCMFALAIIAVIVKACAPSDALVTGLNWAVKCIGAFLFPLLCIKKERAIFKGLAAGAIGVLLTLFLFAAIGGGFHVTVLFPVELVACAVLGGAGALLGSKLRKR